MTGSQVVVVAGQNEAVVPPLEATPAISPPESYTTIADPHRLLQDSPDIGYGIEIVHFSTLFSGETISAEGEPTQLLLDRIREYRAAGVNQLYIVGCWEMSTMSELAQHFYRENVWDSPPPEEYVASSAFSILGYYPRQPIGNEVVLERVIEAFRSEEIEFVADYIPNTRAFDSDEMLKGGADIAPILQDQPELTEWIQLIAESSLKGDIWMREKSVTSLGGERIDYKLTVGRIKGIEIMKHERSANHGNDRLEIYLRKDPDAPGNRNYFWVLHTVDGLTTISSRQLGVDHMNKYTPVWNDVARIRLWNSQTLDNMARDLFRLSRLFKHLRGDMTHLLPNEAWNGLKARVEELGGVFPQIMGEAYCAQHGRLVNEGLATVYCDWIRDAVNEVYDERDEVPDDERGMRRLRKHLSADDQEHLIRGHGVVCTANHDDAKGGDLGLELRKLATLISLPAKAVLLAQGQRTGDPFHYCANMHVSWDQFQRITQEAIEANAWYKPYADKLVHLMTQDVFRSEESEYGLAALEVDCDMFIDHRVRTLGEEAVLSVVDYRNPSAEIVVDIPKTFGREFPDLDGYRLVNLLTGDAYPTTEKFLIEPPADGDPYIPLYLALVPCDSLETRLQ